MLRRSHRVAAAWLLAGLATSSAGGLTITLNFDAVQSVAPAFDPSGAQLQAIMQSAADRWERVIGLGHNLTINFWYEDIPGTPLGTHTTTAFVGDRVTVADIRFDSAEPGGAPRLWFLDPTPDLDEEYDMTQRLYRDLSPAQQTDFFDGTPPDVLEVGYSGAALPSAPSAARNGFDLLSVALHEIAHAMGVPAANPGNTEAGDRDYDFRPSLIGGATAAARADGFLNLDTDHLADDFSLLTGGLAINQRRRISATDVLAVDSVSGWVILNLPRKDFIGSPGVLYNDGANWVGGQAPGGQDLVGVRHGGSAFLGAIGFAGELIIDEAGTELTSFAFPLTVTDGTTVDGGALLKLANNFSGQFGVLNSTTLTIGPTAASTLELDGGQALVGGELLVNLQSEITGNGLVRVGGDLTNGGTITALGDGKTLTLDTTGAGRLVLDGFDGNGGNGKIVVGNGSDSVLLAVDAPLADPFSGDLTMTSGGRIDFNSPWSSSTSMDLFFSGGGSVEGAKLDFNGVLQVSSGSGRITAPIDFEAFTRVVFSQLNAELELFGTTNYIGWNSINPANGRLRQTGDAFFSGAVNLAVLIYDMDGRNENSFITIGNDVTINATQLDIADNVFNGTLEISEPAKLTVNTATAWEMAGTMNLIGAFVSGPEPVLLDGAAPVIISGFVEADGHSQIDAQVTLASTGQIDFPNVGGGSRGLVLGIGSHTIAGGMVTGDGTLGAVSGATLAGFGTISADVDFDSTSQLLADNGTLTISGAVQHAGVLGTASSSGVLSLTQSLTAGTVDEIRLNGGTIQGANISHAGTTTGAGTVNVTSFTTSGTTSPGLSPGVLVFTGDFSQTAGTIEIEIGGTTPGTEHDKIEVGGQAGFSGTLEVLLINAFTPSIGDSFDIFDFATVSGTFATLDLPSLGTGLQWDISDLYTTGEIAVIAGLTADLSGDGDVDDQDLGLFFSAFTGPNLSQGPLTNPAADLSGDGDVDDEDLGFAFGQFTGPLAPINIPEPASVVLIALGGLLLNRRRAAL